jgi:uncharacterized protein (TIGR02145 family)
VRSNTTLTNLSVPALESGVANISFTAINKQLQKPILYVNVTAQLDFKVWNNSQSSLTLQSGDPEDSSTFSIYFPKEYFTPAQLNDMSISVPNWKFDHGADRSLVLIFTGANGTPWGAGTSIDFSVTNVLSTASPAAKNVQINIDNIYNTPGSVQSSLSLINTPAGKAKLSDTLQISLDNQGAVYVSAQNGDQLDPLPNTLMLNLKNSGPAPLYSGKEIWTNSPQVLVTFVYGSTSGSLAPDNIKGQNPPLGSAWNILVSLPVAQSPWSFNNPSKTGQAPDPEWILYPVQSNQEILGIGDQANVTYAFNPVISFTPIGHTQMTLVFTGFKKDDNTFYDDEVFVLDINKQLPPATRGLLNFSSINPVVTISKAEQKISIPLKWGMFDVASIQLLWNYPGAQPYDKDYPIDAVPSTYPLGYDNYTVSIPSISNSQPIFFTLQAYDGLGGFLNSLQFTVYLNLTVFVDTRDGTAYPIIQVGSQLWMAANLQFSSGVYYGNNPNYKIPYGRLFTLDQSKTPVPPEGWRVPTTGDWTNLVKAFTPSGSGPTAYQALIAGGGSGFNAQLGGNYDPGASPQFQNLGSRGYYWTSSPKDSKNYFVVVFSAVSQSITVSATTAPSTNALSVRYVKDI